MDGESPLINVRLSGHMYVLAPEQVIENKQREGCHTMAVCMHAVATYTLGM